MRFAIALVALLAAAVMIVAGVAQRTFLKPPTTISMSASAPADVDYVVIPSSVLRAHPGQQRLRLEGDGPVFAAYGRTADVTAWLSGERYARLGVDAEAKAATSQVAVAPSVAGLTGGGEPDPAGSDLWLDERSGDRALDWPVDLPKGMSMIVASDGAHPAPSTIRLTWPVPPTTPVSGVLLAGGGALAVLGLVLYVWALAHVRRSRGPPRKPPSKRNRRPQPPRFKPTAPVTSGPSRGRRSTAGRSAVHAAAPMLGAALVAGIVASAAGTAPAASAAPREPVATVGEQQAQRIVLHAAETAAKADGRHSVKLAERRFAGPALELRTAAYAIRKKDKKYALPPALPGAGAQLKLILPEATAGWPRSLFAVVEDPSEKDKAPLALTMMQDDPRAAYKVHYAMELPSETVLPVLPSALTGAKRLNPQNTVLRVAPADLATDYGRVLRKSDAKEAALFDTSGDALVKNVGEAAKKKIAKKLGGTASISFADKTVDPEQVVALTTANAVALVSVNLEEKWTVKPKRSGVTVRPSGGTKILAGTSSTGKGIQSVYGYQLLFQVPSAGSTEPIKLLGYAQGLVSAKEL
ncbi:hypothetical protein [Amnibacterium endophyticum]|uniref:DUF8094 domain-containing protein n=1 Tax=Amnibacterium endophyticum TaxID=2109337 RepID=A0ABW4LEV7_9MICO